LGNTQIGGVGSGIHIPQIAGFARFFQTFFDFSNNLLDALHGENGKQFVYKKTRAGIVKQEVRIGAMNDNEVIIEEGVVEDDTLYLSLPAGSSSFSVKYLPPQTDISLSNSPKRDSSAQ
jgi:hypothetical protein